MKSWRFTMTKNWIPGPLVSDFWKLAFFGGVVRSVSTGLKSINLEHMKMPANWHIARFRLRGKTLGWVFFRVQGGGWFGWCAFLGTNEGPTRFVGCCWLGCVACETKQISDSSCWCFFSPRFPQTQIDSSNAFSKRCSLFEAVGWLVGTVQISLGCLAATSRSQPTAYGRNDAEMTLLVCKCRAKWIITWGDHLFMHIIFILYQWLRPDVLSFCDYYTNLQIKKLISYMMS